MCLLKELVWPGYGNRYSKVRDYYLQRQGTVAIQDVSAFVPGLIEAAVEAQDPRVWKAFALDGSGVAQPGFGIFYPRSRDPQTPDTCIRSSLTAVNCPT
jgi:hypothetical protein